MGNKLGQEWGFAVAAPNAPDDRFVLPSQQIGLEIEAEGVDADRAIAWTGRGSSVHWTATRDSSLHDFGLEFVFRKPLYGKSLWDAIHNFCDFAKEGKYRVSERTGIHVHLDISDMEMSQLINMLSIYAVLEPCLFEWEGNRRQENIYCIPWGMSTFAAKQVSRLVSGIHPKKIMDMGNRYKYSALNLSAIPKFCTVEYRHLRTVYDPRKIIEWINLIMMIKKAGMAGVSARTFGCATKLYQKETALRSVMGPLAEVLIPYAACISKSSLLLGQDIERAVVKESLREKRIKRLSWSVPNIRGRETGPPKGLLYNFEEKRGRKFKPKISKTRGRPRPRQGTTVPIVPTVPILDPDTIQRGMRTHSGPDDNQEGGN